MVYLFPSLLVSTLCTEIKYSANKKHVLMCTIIAGFYRECRQLAVSLKTPQS